MESSGTPNRIHASHKTAEELIKRGKGDWVKERSDLVDVKGIGVVQTYWIEPIRNDQLSSSAGSHQALQPLSAESNEYMTIQPNHNGQADETGTEQLIAWSAEALESLLRPLVHRTQMKKDDGDVTIEAEPIYKTPREEIAEVLSMENDNGGGLLDGTFEAVAAEFDSFPIASCLGLDPKGVKCEFPFWVNLDFDTTPAKVIWEAGKHG